MSLLKSPLSAAPNGNAPSFGQLGAQTTEIPTALNFTTEMTTHLQVLEAPQVLSVAPPGVAVLGAQPPMMAGGFDVTTVDIAETFLQGKRSEGTKRAYRADFKGFFGEGYTAETVRDFLLWPPAQVAGAMQVHKNQMIQADLGADAINRRFSALRSLFRFAYRWGAASCDGRNLVDSERTKTYRDTSGISVEQVKKLLAAPAKRAGLALMAADAPVIVLRDTAILALFCMQGLRCNEVSSADTADFNLFDRKLSILGKGRGTQKQRITLQTMPLMAIELYLRAAGHKDGALFRNLDHNPATTGQRITNRAIFKIVRSYGAQIGCPDLHPHALRHTSITQVLIKNKGNITAAMEFSRHLDPKILMRYYHNSQDLQGEMSDLLGDLFADEPKPKRKK